MIWRALRLILEGRTQGFGSLILLGFVVEFQHMPIRVGKLVGLPMPYIAIDPALPMPAGFNILREPVESLRTPRPERRVRDPRLPGFRQLERIAFIFSP